MRMASPTFEPPEHININTDDDVLDSMRKTGTFLSPFESNKGRNKPDKTSKSGTKSRRKTHSRWKSGFTKLAKRNNLNKSVLENIKNKPPTSIENRGATSLSMQYKRQSVGSTPGMTTPSQNIDKLIRDNLKKNKEKELVKEIEELQFRGDLLMK